MGVVAADETLDARPAGRGLAVSAWAVVAAFGTYFCMYAFRKPFTAAEFADLSVAGVGYKTALVVSQVLGYTLAKFVGIKVIAEMRPHRRAAWLVGLIVLAETALLAFAVVPRPIHLACLFVNGLALGMVFGLVLGFIEGRRQTEALTAGLCASFIVADGVVRSAGAYVLEAGATDFTMPALTGLLFFLPFLVFVWMLTRVPVPSAADRAARTERVPMTRAERRAFFQRYALGLLLIVDVYLLVTILRTVRSDFAREIWTGLGAKVEAKVFAQSEMVVGASVLLLAGLAVFIRDNRRAFRAAVGLGVAGLGLVGLALLAVRDGYLSPFAFMVLSGLGLYLPYVVVHTTLFERLIAMTRDRGNIGYLMYVADAVGYLGVVAVVLAKNFLHPSGEFLDFYVGLSWVVVLVGIPMLIPVVWYFTRRRPVGEIA